MKRTLMAVTVLACMIAGCGPSAADLRQEGIMQYQVGQGQEARQTFEQVLRIKPADGDSLYYLGRIYHDRGEYAKALAYYQMALDADPGHRSAQVYIQRAERDSGLQADTIRFVP